MIIIAAVLGIIGIGALLYFEAKIIGALVTGLAAITLVLSFMGTQEASTLKAQAVQQRDSAEFDREFASMSGTATKEKIKILDERVTDAIANEKTETAKAKIAYAKAKDGREEFEKKLSLDDSPLPAVQGSSSKPVKQMSKE